jgi:hypothetical protein
MIAAGGSGLAKSRRAAQKKRSARDTAAGVSLVSKDVADCTLNAPD